MDFTPTGDLLTDLNSCIETQTAMHIGYVDKKGAGSDRVIAPLEVRGDRVYAWDLEKNGLRLFILANITSFDVVDQKFDKEQFKTQ